MTEKQKTMIKKKEECKRLWETTDLTGEEIAKKAGVSPTTFWRWKNENSWERNVKKESETNQQETILDSKNKDEIFVYTISLKTLFDLLHAIRKDKHLSFETKGFALDFIPRLIGDEKDTIKFLSAEKLINSIMWMQLEDYYYIHYTTDKFNGLTCKFGLPINSEKNITEKVDILVKENEKLKGLLNKYKELGDLID